MKHHSVTTPLELYEYVFALRLRAREPWARKLLGLASAVLIESEDSTCNYLETLRAFDEEVQHAMGGASVDPTSLKYSELNKISSFEVFRSLREGGRV
jgi:hypothetical protein